MLEEKYMIEGKDKHNIIFEEQYDYFNIDMSILIRK